MNIKEFAESRGKRPNTVTNYIRSHPEIFSGHTRQSKNSVELDEIALEFLDKKYPPVKPVEIVHDPETEQALQAAKDEIIRLQRRLEAMQERLNQVSEKATLYEGQLLLTDHQAKLLEANAKREQEIVSRIREQDQQIGTLTANLKDAEQSAEQERTRADAEALKASKAVEEAEEQRKLAEQTLDEIERLKRRSLWARILNK